MISHRVPTPLSLLFAVAVAVAFVVTSVGCSSNSTNKDASAQNDGSAGGSGSGGVGGGSGGGSGSGGGGSGGTIQPPVDAAGGGAGQDSGRRETDAVADFPVGPEIGGDIGGDRPPTTSGRGPAGGACVAGATYGTPLPQNRTATVVRDGFVDVLLEGPVWVASQRALYFSEVGDGVTEGRLQKFTPADNGLVVFADNVGVGGLAMDAQGMLVAASHDGQRLTRFDPATGQRTDVTGGAMYMGNPFNQVNDVVVRADGNMYFSDPTYKLGGRPGQGVMAFYRLSPAGVVTRIATAMNPNGVAVSPDGATLYLSTTGGGGAPLQRFGLADDGSITGAGAMLINNRSDGIAVDCAGNLYLTDGEIKVYSPTGQPIGNIGGLTAGFVTNSAFGGDDRKTLYITTSEALYQIVLNVPGFPN